MGAYILRRLAMSVPMLVAISLIAFTVINVAPGDPVAAMITPEDRLQPQDLQRMREALGLNKPIPVRYALWLGQIVRGNLGYSYATSEPVRTRIGARIWPTLELMGAAFLLSTICGILLGVASALRANSFWDYALSILSLLGLSVPGFFFALVALYIFAARLQVMPAFGMSGRTVTPRLLDNLHHLILPALTLSLELTASMTRYARAAMREVLREDYVTTARAKGLAESRVMWRHAFRNALLPLITVISLRLPLLVGGAIIIETMFQWPGIGLLSIQAIQQRDYAVLMGLTLVVAALVLFSNLLADVLYAVADPRIRY